MAAAFVTLLSVRVGTERAPSSGGPLIRFGIPAGGRGIGGFLVFHMTTVGALAQLVRASLQLAGEVAVQGDRVQVMSTYFLCGYAGLSLPVIAAGELSRGLGVLPAAGARRSPHVPGARFVSMFLVVKVTIAAVGSTGDVRPMVALGVGLDAQGHHVRVATHAHFRPLVEDRGLEFWPVAGDPIDELSTSAGRDWLASGANPIGFARFLGEMARQLAAAITRDCLAACTGCDVIVGSLLGNALAWQVGEKLGVPVVPAYLQPRTPTSYYPDLFFPDLVPNGDGYAQKPGPALRLYHRTSYRTVRWLAWKYLRDSVNDGRRLIGLPPLGRGNHFGGALEAPSVIYGYSPLVAPSPPDWGPDSAVTGYWVLDDAAGWTPPPGLSAFIQAGEPPVYVGFGSMIHSAPEHTARMVLDALDRAGRRGIVSAGWGGLRADQLPASVFAVGPVPHEWLFPRVAAVVHHGGAGTTAAGLRAGRPSVITPFFADQGFWGRRVHAMGIGPRPIPFARLTTERLAGAITEATRSTQMRARAEELGDRLRGEQGVSRGVAELERLVEEWPGWDAARRRWRSGDTSRGRARGGEEKRRAG